ncbi:MAG: hypothetical protein KGP14_02360, partial [Betaproteobacteria bacterium]|nr:hypothetical protein [Betaproteobacteria bacterium]
MDDPFAQFGPIGSAGVAAPPQPPEPVPPPVPTVQTASGTEPGPNPSDPFAKFGDFVEPPTTITGTIAHAVERGVAPVIAGMPAAGAGARIGAVAGAAIPGLGETGLGETGGALVGGIAGFWVGADAVGRAQQYMVSKLPLWAQQAVGQDVQQQAAEGQQHPIAQFIGDMAPQALVMSPKMGIQAAENIGTTTWQKLMANPVTARIMSGAFMAGNEAVQEKMQGQPLDPLRIGIATGIGMIWARQNALGSALSNWGEHVVGWRASTGPTPADLADAKVAGPGITEKVFRGEEAQAPKPAADALADAQLQKMAEPAAPEAPKPYEAPAEHGPAIANDVATQLIKAGRPIDEALAAGDLIASHYVSRATRFEGGIGEPLDIYNRDGAFIRGQGDRGTPPAPVTVAVPKPPEPSSPAQAAEAPISAPSEPVAQPFAPTADQKAAFGQFLSSKKPITPENLAPAVGGDTQVATRLIQQGIMSRQIIATKTGRYIRKASAPDRPVNVMEFIAKNGGLKDDGGELSARDLKPANTRTVYGSAVKRNGGKSLDAMRELLVEAGYLHDEGRDTGGQATTTGQDVLDLMDRHSKANPVVSFEDQAWQDEINNATAEKEFFGNYTKAEGAFIREYGVQLLDELKAQNIDAKSMKPEDLSLAQQLIHDGMAPHDAIVDASLRNFREADSDVTPEGVSLETAAGLDKIPPPRSYDDYLEATSRDTAIAGAEGNGSARQADISGQRTEGDVALETARREAAAQHAEQYARELLQSARGRIRLQEGKRPIITLMKDANASTFIHETGHQWLEEMLRDAAHDAAPAGLKADMQTVRDWLKMDEGKMPTTRQHEKFARGFEQYMREGKAPSPGLVGVFEKFRGWLTTIYQTIKGLGLPINDDIRGVFDRLIASDYKGKTIANGGPTLTDIHRADAAHTEPAEAEPARDRVRAEMARSEQEAPSHVQAEIQASDARTTAAAGTDAGGQASNGQGGTGPLDANSSRPDSQQGNGALRSAAGDLGKGSGATVGKSPAASSGTTAGPVSPHEPFAPDDPHIDKAGNIRLDTLTTNEDVKAAIRESAQANDDFIAARRGVITDGMVMDLADALGMDYRQLSERKLGQAFNAEQVMAARKLLIESASTVHGLMKAAATGTDQDVMAYAQARDRHQMIQAQVSGITAEAGRALRAFRNIAGDQTIQNVDQFLRGATGKTLYQLRQEAQLGLALDTPQQVSKFMDDAAKRSYGRMALEYWINGLISGPSTHITYMIGNTILAAQKVGPETALAAAIGDVRARMGRGGERVRMGEVAAQLRGLKTGLPSAIKSAIDAFAEGTTTLLPTEKPRDLIYQTGTPAKQSYLQEGASYHDAIGAAFSLVRGIRDGVMAGARELEMGGEQGAPLIGPKYSTLGAIPDIAVKGVNVLPLGAAARLPGRFVASIHSFFRAANYSMEKAALAYRQASEEGLIGAQFDARVADLHMNPTEAMMEQARKEATDLTLMGRAGPLTERVSKFFNHELNLPFLGPTPLLKFINPFMHIGMNIINKSIVERTPVGLLHPQIRADLAGTNGNIAADRAAARMMAGTGLAVMFGSLAAEGYVSGSGPDDPKKRAMWLLAGNQPHSVRIGDTWYQMNRLGPMGMLASISADMYEVGHYASQDDMQQAGAALQMAFTQTVMHEGWMKGPSDFLRAVENRDGYRAIYLRDFLSSFVPYSVGSFQMVRAMDPYSRQAKTLIDAIKKKIPGLSESLMPRRDIWGEPIANKDALGAPGLTAVYEQQVSRDPVNQTMWSLGVYPSQPE